jgi:GNAT superfamily N-acetyltransferase
VFSGRYLSKKVPNSFLMSDSLCVEQFKLSEKNALLSFLQIAYADNLRQSDACFWDWHFLQNPLVKPDNLPVWVAKHNQKIVGQLAGTPVNLKVGGENRRAIWILDFIVGEKYRGQGLGKKLVLAAQDFCPLGLGITTHQQISPALLQKLGWAIVSNVPRYNKILFPGNALREIARIKPLRKFVNFSFAPFRPRSSSPSLLFDKKRNLRIVREFDSSFDELWRESSAQCGVERSSMFLNWQYRRQPGKNFDVLGYYENDKLLGYAVLFFRKSDADGVVPKAAITDFCYHPEKPQETIDELLRGALQIAVERCAGVLVTDILDPLLQDRLRALGFRRTKSPLLLMVKSDAGQDLLFDESRWFLTRGDSDISIFEHPNLPHKE